MLLEDPSVMALPMVKPLPHVLQSPLFRWACGVWVHGTYTPQVFDRLPARLPVCPPACLPACLPAPHHPITWPQHLINRDAMHPEDGPNVMRVLAIQANSPSTEVRHAS